jgi:hypothetical protein
VRRVNCGSGGFKVSIFAGWSGGVGKDCCGVGTVIGGAGTLPINHQVKASKGQQRHTRSLFRKLGVNLHRLPHQRTFASLLSVFLL